MDTIKHEPQKYYMTLGQHEPSLKIKSGQRVQVTLPDCDGYDPDGEVLDKSRFEQNKNGTMIPANPCAGPYYIEDAQVGDSIAVHIENIEIDRDFGRTGIGVQQVHIPQKLFADKTDKDLNVIMPRKVSRWQIDRQNNIARLKLQKSRKKYIEVELNPFCGTIAVAPANEQFIHSLYTGNHCGNVDIVGLGAGCCIYLPVFAPGAYLFLGDIHAAQGNGEIIGGAIEVGGIVTFRVELIKGKKLSWPRFETAQKIGAIGAQGNLDECFNIAFSQLVLWLSEEYGYDRWEALHLLSQTVEARPGNYMAAMAAVAKSYL